MAEKYHNTGEHNTVFRQSPHATTENKNKNKNKTKKQQQQQINLIGVKRCLSRAENLKGKAKG